MIEIELPVQDGGIDEGDWDQAVNPAWGASTAVPPRQELDQGIGLDDVAQVELWHGEGGPWSEVQLTALLCLKDGQYASVTAWSDYTGWDCRSGSSICIGTRDEVIRFGFGNAERKQLGLDL